MARTLLFLLALLLITACPDPRGGPPTDDDDGAGDDDDGDDDDSSADDDDGSDDDDSSADDDDGSDDDDASDDDDSSVDPCDAALSRLTNIGCEFWAVDLDNAENFVDNAAGAQFAVAIANVHDTLTANVQVWINEADVGDPLALSVAATATIAPGSLEIVNLPRRDVDGENISVNVDDGPQTWWSSRAFRINADAPIVAYQFNTIDQQYSNDASLLLPTHALGVMHHVLTHMPSGPFGGGFGPENRGYVTVVGVHPGTTVAITPTFDIVAGEGVPPVDGEIGILADTTANFNIGEFDVVNLETMLIDIFDLSGDMPDLTGTTVSSNLPVAVFTGTDLSVISDGWNTGDGCCAEHIEEQVLPTRAMRNTFVVSRSAVRSTSTPENDVYRIMAGGEAASVVTSLPGDDASFSLAAGEFRELIAGSGFIVEATVPIQIAQYLVQGGDVPSGQYGDSSMLVVPPVEQRRDSYIFTTGVGFASNHVVVSMVDGTAAELDGTDLAAYGCSGPATEGTLGADLYVAWECDIADGVHTLDAADDVGIYVYGYYNAGSYAYPGGAGLE